MGVVLPFVKPVKKAPHDWGRSTLNHGSAQCRRCLCTWEEARYALGQDCEIK